MMGWFRKLLPREDRFFDYFAGTRTVVLAASAGEASAGEDIDKQCAEIIGLEDEADHITAEVLLACGAASSRPSIAATSRT